MEIDFKELLLIKRQMDMVFIFKIMEVFIKDIGKMIYSKVSVNWHFSIKLDIKDNLHLERGMEKVNLLYHQVLSSKDNGKMERLMELVHTYGLMDVNTLDNGKIIKWMVKEHTNGKMVENI